MATLGMPMIGAMPQFNAGQNSPDDIASASPVLQALLSQTGGWQGSQNVDAMAANNPQWGSMLSMMQPPGGLNTQQASQFGPLFAMLMSLQGR